MSSITSSESTTLTPETPQTPQTPQTPEKPDFTQEEKGAIAALSIGISMEIWSPACWRLLNVLCFGARCDPDWFATLMESLVSLLPCPMCRHHLSEYIEKNPPPRGTDDPETSQRWLVSFHNSTSKRLGQPEREFDTVRDETLTFLTANEGKAFSSCNDLWTFLLAVGTLYTSASHGPSMKVFIEELCNLFPIQAAADALEDHPIGLDTAATLFTSVLGARNRWAAGARGALEVEPPEWGYVEAVEKFAPPQLYEALGVVDPADISRLNEMFRARTEQIRLLQRKAYARINGTNGIDSLAHYTSTHNSGCQGCGQHSGMHTHPSDMHEWSNSQITGVVLAVIGGLVLLIILIFMATKAWKKGDDPA